MRELNQRLDTSSVNEELLHRRKLEDKVAKRRCSFRLDRFMLVLVLQNRQELVGYTCIYETCSQDADTPAESADKSACGDTDAQRSCSQ